MKLLFFIFPLVIFSCHSNNRQNTQIELRDSLVKTYLTFIDSIGWADSLTTQHKLLVAYNKNDTNFLRNEIKRFQDAIIDNKKFLNPTSCFTPQTIDKYNFNEGYRFQYSAAFCDQSVNITVGKLDDSIILIGYHYTHNYKTDSCISIDSVKMQLKENQWNQIQLGIKRADLWGLKPFVQVVGVDGSDLTVIGYEKPVNAFEGRYCKVGRWAAEKTALGEIFNSVLQMSKIKVACFHY